jgi:hypothetical protein
MRQSEPQTAQAVDRGPGANLGEVLEECSFYRKIILHPLILADILIAPVI